MVLAAQAEWLKRQPELVVVIEGHADDPGPAEENLRIAAARAQAVRERLVGDGVSLARTAVQAAGNTDRVAVRGEPACAAQNRRALTLVQALVAPVHGPAARPGAGDGSAARANSWGATAAWIARAALTLKPERPIPSPPGRACRG